MATLILLASVLFLGQGHAAFPDCVNGPLRDNTVCDTSALPLDRAKALVSVMTLAEKMNNTGNTSPGVPRLGLPAYDWWSEALHGVAYSPGINYAESGNFSYATSFPQPILMGAAFDDQLINAVATVISTEARAFSNANRSGLDFWTPNINPFKDPRWGRGQETPGEDPFHLSSYVRALIDGLQGGYDPKYKRIIATCKHWVGYDMENWQGNSRHRFDAQITSQDYAEYYTPSFQACARDSNVGAFMCSYNAVNGVPTCADPYVLQTILREHWNWTNEQQWVTGDCDAVQDIFSPHNYTDSPEKAVAAALNAGTDIDCGGWYQRYLPNAYSQGLFNESVLDQALTRQYSSLVRVGYFDPPEDQPYRALDFSDINTAPSQALSYKAAVEGIVLLKNNNTLPLILANRSVAIVGDWANNTRKLQGNYFGGAPYLRTPLYAAQSLPGIKVNYANGPSPSDPVSASWPALFNAANASDMIIYIGGISNSEEAEGRDRNTITWGAGQIDVITRLSAYGKPMVVVQMGGGQIDSSPIANNPNIGGLLWGGYPGQDGGTAIIDIITGKVAPAGRLPLTQYPAEYVQQVAMTDMSLRPSETSPGRTYRWYNGKAIFEFGHGLHYANFTLDIKKDSFLATFDTADLTKGCTEKYLDLCPLATVPITVSNVEGHSKSDYVVLGFIAGENGPAPYPKKTLVAYERLHGISSSASQTAQLKLTLASLSRVVENGDRVLFPGEYQLQVDTPAMATVNITVTGEEVILDNWPQPPARDPLSEAIRPSRQTL